jgi:hypothetical protein
MVKPRMQSSCRKLLAAFAVVGIVAALLLTLEPSGIDAAQFDVTNTNDSGAGSLRQAIADAATAAGDDVVVVQPGLGTITLTTGAIDYGAGALGIVTVQGNGVPVDANGASTAITNSSPVSINIDDVTVTGATGNAVDGAAGGVTITNSTFTGNNRAANTSSGPLVILDSRITGNTGLGDVINTSSGALVITRTSIVDNAGNAGNTASGEVTISRSTLSGNLNRGFNSASGNLTFIESTISGNGDPGINTSNGAITLIRSTVSGHIGTGGPGGVRTSSGEITLVNSTVTDNSSDSEGGGIQSDTGNVTLVYATVTSNSSPASANIEFIGGGSLTSFGAVIALPGGGGANCALIAATVSNGYNFSDDASCALTGTGDTENGPNPQLGALADNGGPTVTRLPAPNSPLLDVIPIASCPFDGVTVDQRTVTRPQGNGCDIGAVEVEVPGPPAPSPAPGAVPVAAAPRFTG